MRVASALAAVLALTGPVSAGGKTSDVDARLQTIAPFVNGQTFAVARFDLTREGAEDLILMLGGIGQPSLGLLAYFPEDDLRRSAATLRRAGVKEFFAVYSFADLKEAPIFVVPMTAGTNEKMLAELLSPTRELPDIYAEQIAGRYVLGSKEACQRYRTFKAVARHDLAKALAAAGDTTVQFAVALGQDAKRAFEEILPVLPAELGGGPITVWTRGVQWVAVGMDGSPKSGLQAVIQATDEPAAVKLHESMTTMLKKLGKMPDLQKTWPNWAIVVAGLEPTRAADRLLVKLDHQQMTALMQPLVHKAQQVGQRQKAVNALKQLALAMHLYADKHKGTFPTPAGYDKQGKPLLSWRVHLLPYLEQSKLYQEFHLDEPWNSAHNIKLVAKMPALYRHPGNKGVVEGQTPYLVPVGKDTIFPGGKGIGIKEITDGTSNTVLIFEVGDDRMVTWTKPDDLPFDPKDPHRGLLFKGREAFAVALADGSVRLVQATISADTLRALITRNGGEAVGSDF
jgi:hypothetical protein